MVNNPSLLDTLKELENLSHVDVQDPEDEEFEGGRVSTFQETVDEQQLPTTTTTVVKNKFRSLRKTVANDGEVDKKYAGEKSSRKSIIAWSDEDEDEDNNEDNNEDGEDDDIDDAGSDCSDDGDDNIDIDEEKDINQDEESDDEMANKRNGSVSGDDDDDDVEDGDDDDDSDEDVEDGDDDSDEDKHINGNGFDDANNGDDIEDDDNDVDGIDDDETLDGTMNIDFSKLPDELKGALSQTKPDSDDTVSHFTAPTADDNVQKGESTKLQLDILDKLLESRIRLQKSLHLCNQLPQHDVMAKFTNDAGPQVKEAYGSAKISMKELLNKLLKLQEELCETNTETSTILTTGAITSTDPGDEEIPSDTEDEDEEGGNDDSNKEKTADKNSLNLPSKRKHTLTVSEYGEEVVKRHKAFQPFQETTINKWHEKTRLASSIVSSKNFASFDKSVMQQIKQVLMDKDRLIKRTQLSRVPLNILGKQTEDDETTNTEESKTEDNVDIHLKNYDENIFDDGDFYHEMLKELIERKSNIDADDPVAAGRRWLELQKLRSKIKRKVDTRASKGRKVRYDVHTKLVSFMAPQNFGTVGDQARNNLFASLFGQKSTVVACGS